MSLEPNVVIVAGHKEDFESGVVSYASGCCGDGGGAAGGGVVSVAVLTKSTLPQELIAYGDALFEVDPETNIFAWLKPFLPPLVRLEATEIRKSPPLSSSLPRLLGVTDEEEEVSACRAVVSMDDLYRIRCRCLEQWQALREEWISTARPFLIQKRKDTIRKEIHRFIKSLPSSSSEERGCARSLPLSSVVEGATDELCLMVESAVVSEPLHTGLEQDKDVASPASTCVFKLTLVNVVAHMRMPCVLDLKIGKIRHHPCTPLHKRNKILKNEGGPDSSPSQLGCRVCGVQHYYKADGETGVWEKERDVKGFGHELRSRTYFANFLTRFFSPEAAVVSELEPGGTACARRSTAATSARLIAAVSSIIRSLRQTIFERKELLEKHTALVSCSLLVVYDAAIFEDKRTVDDANVYLIDLARSGPRQWNYNEDSIDVLWSLESFEGLLTEASKNNSHAVDVCDTGGGGV